MCFNHETLACRGDARAVPCLRLLPTLMHICGPVYLIYASSLYPVILQTSCSFCRSDMTVKCCICCQRAIGSDPNIPIYRVNVTQCLCDFHAHFSNSNSLISYAVLGDDVSSTVIDAPPPPVILVRWLITCVSGIMSCSKTKKTFSLL